MSEIKEHAKKIISQCVKLGFPPEAFPDVPYIEKIGRARNCEILDRFLVQTNTKEIVRNVRNNILIQTSKDEDRFSKRNQLQRFITAMKLKEEICEVGKMNEQIKQRERSHLDAVYNNAIDNKLNEDLSSTKELQSNILRASIIRLDEENEKETKIEMKIRNGLKIDNKVDDMKNGIARSLSLLKSFYSDTTCKTSNTEIWNDLREGLSSTSNFFTFQSIVKQLDASNNVLELLSSSAIVDKNKISHFQQLALNLKSQEIVSGVEWFSQKGKLKFIKSVCSRSVQNVTHDLEGIMNTSIDFSFEFNDELVGDYISVMLEQFVMQGKSQQTSKIIDSLKVATAARDLTTKKYLAMVNSTAATRSAMNQDVLDAQESVAEMLHINNKIYFGKISMTHLVQDVNAATKHQAINRAMKLKSVDENAFPMHRCEQQAFLDTSVSHFHTTSSRVRYELNKLQPTITDADSFDLLKKCTNSDPNCAHSIVNYLKSKFLMNRKFEQVFKKVVLKTARPSELSIDEFKMRRENNRQTILQLLDQVTHRNSSTKSLMREFQLLYNYSVHNPLKSYIPKDKKFNSKSFKSYENDFNLYYRMIKD